MAKKIDEDRNETESAPAHDPSDSARPAQFDDAPTSLGGHFAQGGHVQDGRVAPPLAVREEEDRLRLAEVQRAQLDEHGAARLDDRYSGKVIPMVVRRDLIEEQLTRIVGYPAEVARIRELVGGF